ncbi:MAG: type IV pilin N-terminal domain-containing protein [Candidatus Methanoperedens sp.]|nr:type IV pilin N-terminal domain-containing protein [Candidatus Methanoperedens nitroreducens]MDJ1421655.1 type IV pilin N-terminal domain-containing protein [Candidatus Methanoperedens sp.]
MKNFKNEEAVSPVIGVILMVVITVIIAAIMAVFAFGIGAPDKTPQANLKFTATATDFKISHSGGEPLILANEKIIIEDAVTSGTYYDTTAAGALLSTFTGVTTLAPGASATHTWISGPSSGDIIIVQVVDIPTGQLISDTKVTVQ